MPQWWADALGWFHAAALDVRDVYPALLLLAFPSVNLVLAWRLRQQDQLWRGPEHARPVGGVPMHPPKPQQATRPWLQSVVRWGLGAVGLAGLVWVLAEVSPAWVAGVNDTGMVRCEREWVAGVRCTHVLAVPKTDASATWVLATVWAAVLLLWRMRRLAQTLATPTVWMFMGLLGLCLVLDLIFALPIRHLPSMLTSLYNLMVVFTVLLGVCALCTWRASWWRWGVSALLLPLAWSMALWLTVNALGLVFGAVGMLLLFAFFVWVGMPLVLAAWAQAFTPRAQQRTGGA